MKPASEKTVPNPFAPLMRLDNSVVVATIGVAILLAGLLGEYQRFVGVQILISMLLAVSFRGLFRTGVFSLAGPAFMGIGAYSYSLIQLDGKISPAFALCLALGVCVVAALLAAPVIWRVSRIYLALLTLCLAVILTMLYGELKITGGHGGRYGIKIPTPGGVEGWYWYAFCVGTTTAILLGLTWIERGALGRAWRAIGVNADFAESAGIRSKAYSFLAFSLFSTIAAYSGILLAGNNGYVYPGAFGFERVVLMLLCVFIGGVTSFSGPLFGAIFIAVLQELLSSYEQFTMFILGTSLVLVILVFPNGLVSIPSMMWRGRKLKKQNYRQTLLTIDTANDRRHTS